MFTCYSWLSEPEKISGVGIFLSDSRYPTDNSSSCSSRNTWLACSYLPFSDGRGRRAREMLLSRLFRTFRTRFCGSFSGRLWLHFSSFTQQENTTMIHAPVVVKFAQLYCSSSVVNGTFLPFSRTISKTTLSNSRHHGGYRLPVFTIQQQPGFVNKRKTKLSKPLFQTCVAHGIFCYHNRHDRASINCWHVFF